MVVSKIRGPIFGSSADSRISGYTRETPRLANPYTLNPMGEASLSPGARLHSVVFAGLLLRNLV